MYGTHSVISGGKDRLVAVGGKHTQEELIKAQKENSLKRLTSTEIIIEKALKLLDTDPWDDLGEWPADAHIHKGMRLSESKMLNEIDVREPRT